MGKKSTTSRSAAAAAAATGLRRGGAAAFIASSAETAGHDADADADDTTGKRFALYQRAVQHPAGDISWALKFHRLYALPGETALPLHLREDFSGAALLASHWLRGSPLRSALGVDLDRHALTWGHEHNFQGVGSRACLVHANVLDDLEGPKAALVPPTRRDEKDEEDEAEDDEERLRVLRRRADLVLAMNYSLCLMHTRADAVRYLRVALRALSEGEGSDESSVGPSTGLLLLDLLGGHANERAGVAFTRRNPLTGGRYRWEQARYDPLARRLLSHLHLLPPPRRPQKGGEEVEEDEDEDDDCTRRRRGKRRPVEAPVATFTYDWRLWTLPDAIELLREAGHAGDVRVWARRVRDGDEDDEEVEEEFDEYVEYRPGGSGADLDGLAQGWSAYVVAVVRRPAGRA